MLSLINITVIPFLLGALMSVEDVEEWNFGPVYAFQLNKLTKIYVDPKLGIYLTENVTAMVWCRPKLSLQSIQDILFCHAKTITGRPILSRQIHNWKNNVNLLLETSIDINGSKSINFHEGSTNIPDHIFKIEFGRQGVQNFKVKEIKKELHYYDIITNIIDQFNIGSDWSIVERDSMPTHKIESYVISTFMPYEEDTVRASKCSTSGVIMYPIDTSYQYNKSEKFFQLRLLPISYIEPTSKNLWMERNRMACTQQPQYIMLSNEEWQIDNMFQYSNILNIHDKNRKFTSHTHLEGNVYFPISTNSVHKFEEDVYFHLLRIEAAREELNTVEYD
ncbi:uncharacterized protein [Linepithema humile]|uniref:uncharacterized protein isoform X5 n=1 Tax=Linepithema humile TaxID=83485 RepID=UPI00351E5C59